jgi:hypothetical protein
MVIVKPDLERDELALRMLCAFNNVPYETERLYAERDQLLEPGQRPSGYASFHNPTTKAAWARVADAARSFLESK